MYFANLFYIGSLLQLTLVGTGNTANFGMLISFQISKDIGIGLLPMTGAGVCVWLVQCWSRPGHRRHGDTDGGHTQPPAHLAGEIMPETEFNV